MTGRSCSTLTNMAQSALLGLMVECLNTSFLRVQSSRLYTTTKKIGSKTGSCVIQVILHDV